MWSATSRAASTSSSIASETGQAAEFRAAHGPSANGMAFRVADAKAAYEHGDRAAARRRPTRGRGALGEAQLCVIEGIGGTLSLSGRPPWPENSLYADWKEIPGWREAEAENNVGLDLLDHLTHNVRRGQMRDLVRLLRPALRLRGAEIFRHQGPGDRPVQPGDDRARQGDPHPAQREPGRARARSRSSSASTRARASSISRSPPTISTRRSRSCAPTASAPGHDRDLLRAGRQARARPWRGSRAAAQEPHPDRRRAGERGPAAADLHREHVRPDLLRDHPAQGQ